MGFNINKYIKRSSKDAFSRISDDVSNKLQDAATNAVAGALGKGLKAVGLSNKIVNDITSRFADSVRAELGAEWYQTSDPVLNRLSGEGIRKNRAPSKGLASNQSFEKNISEGENWAARGASTPYLSFPKDNLGRYYCAFEFRKYERPAPQLAATPIALKTVFLPIPRNLVETHGITYENAPLGAIGAVADSLQKGGEGLGKALGATAGDVLLKNLQKINPLDTGAGNAATTFIQQAYGFAANPHLSVLFKGGTLREHTFRWLLAPESPEESYELREIVNDFRRFSLPTFFGDTTAVFDYPKMCKVRFFPWASGNASGSNNPNDLYTIKQCMIKNIVVNYAPNGIPSFFAGTDLPTMIEFEVQLQEIEYFTSEDFGGAASEKKLSDIADAVEKAIGGAAGGGETSEPTRTNERKGLATAAEIARDPILAGAGFTGDERRARQALAAAKQGKAAPFDLSGPKY